MHVNNVPILTINSIELLDHYNNMIIDYTVIRIITILNDSVVLKTF